MTQSDIFKINSDLSEVKVLASHLRVFCSKNLLDDNLSGLLELALVEASNNIIIHAYERLSGFNISAQFTITNKEVIITLIDTGKKYIHEDRAENKVNIETKDLAEGNWGLGLINSIADEINRHRENDSNILTIKKSISG